MINYARAFFRVSDMFVGALTIGLIGTFAVLVAVHVVNVFGIARKRHFGEALG